MSVEPLNGPTVERIFLTESFDEILELFKQWNLSNSAASDFPLTLEEKNTLGDRIAAHIDRDVLTSVFLETIRLLSREKKGLESLLNPLLCNKILHFAGLQVTNGYPKNDEKTLREAQKCLINTMYHSQKMRDQFYTEEKNAEVLQNYLGEFSESRKQSSECEFVREMSPVQASEVWYFYHRIAFIATAMSRDFQKKWANDPKLINNLLPAIEAVIGLTSIPPQDLERCQEALKTFFNVFCHFHGDVQAIDQKNARRVTRALRGIICNDVVGDDVIMSAVHAISVPPLPVCLSVWCTAPGSPELSPESDDIIDLKKDYDNMTMTEAVLAALERQLAIAVAHLNAAENNQITPDAQMCADLMGPYFQTLARLCAESKQARRYCRIRVLPPLVADEVKKRPEEHESLRGRIVRVMMIPSSTKEVAAEFLFIICKRSVNRMIKYVGFGHSAGHLANMGLLGQINQPKHASDSEDSDTEEYNQVKDNVNPVTGAMYPADHGSALAGMTDEQKEVEAMKLVDAMNKMMDAGIVKPGTIGEDGKVRQVEHVLELIKDAPEPDEEPEDD